MSSRIDHKQQITVDVFYDKWRNDFLPENSLFKWRNIYCVENMASDLRMIVPTKNEIWFQLNEQNIFEFEYI